MIAFPLVYPSEKLNSGYASISSVYDSRSDRVDVQVASHVYQVFHHLPYLDRRISLLPPPQSNACILSALRHRGYAIPVALSLSFSNVFIASGNVLSYLCVTISVFIVV
jgi:hypothetical protein